MQNIDIRDRLQSLQTEIRQIREQMGDLDGAEHPNPFALLSLEDREGYIICVAHFLLSLALEGSYDKEGITNWWNRKRAQLNDATPLQYLDTENYLKLHDLIAGIDNFT